MLLYPRTLEAFCFDSCAWTVLFEKKTSHGSKKTMPIYCTSHYTGSGWLWITNIIPTPQVTGCRWGTKLHTFHNSFLLLLAPMCVDVYVLLLLWRTSCVWTWRPHSSHQSLCCLCVACVISKVKVITINHNDLDLDATTLTLTSPAIDIRPSPNL